MFVVTLSVKVAHQKISSRFVDLSNDYVVSSIIDLMTEHGIISREREINDKY